MRLASTNGRFNPTKAHSVPGAIGWRGVEGSQTSGGGRGKALHNVELLTGRPACVRRQLLKQGTTTLYGRHPDRMDQ